MAARRCYDYFRTIEDEVPTCFLILFRKLDVIYELEQSSEYYYLNRSS